MSANLAILPISVYRNNIPSFWGKKKTESTEKRPIPEALVPTPKQLDPGDLSGVSYYMRLKNTESANKMGISVDEFLRQY